MAKHRLELEVENERKESLISTAKSIIKDTQRGIDNRNKWVKKREDEKQELNVMYGAALTAFDNGDAEMLADIRTKLNSYNLGKVGAYD